MNAGYVNPSSSRSPRKRSATVTAALVTGPCAVACAHWCPVVYGVCRVDSGVPHMRACLGLSAHCCMHPWGTELSVCVQKPSGRRGGNRVYFFVRRPVAAPKRPRIIGATAEKRSGVDASWSPSSRRASEGWVAAATRTMVNGTCARLYGLCERAHSGGGNPRSVPRDVR